MRTIRHDERANSSLLLSFAALVVVIVVVVVLVSLAPSLLGPNPAACPPNVCGQGNPPLAFTVRIPVIFSPSGTSYVISVGRPTAQLNTSWSPPPTTGGPTDFSLWSILSLTFPNGIVSTYQAGSQAAPWMTAPGNFASIASFNWWQYGPHGTYSMTVTIYSRYAGCTAPASILDCTVKSGQNSGSFMV